MSRTILVVDDKVNMRRLVSDYLTEHGFEVMTADNGRTALSAARLQKPDLIILDIMMPEMDGYEFLRIYRQEKSTPVILLTARLEESDKVAGLDLGADDYVTKPFGMRELLARINAVLRRAGMDTPASEVIRAGGVTLDRGSRMVTVDGQPVKLTPSEFELLAMLAESPGRVFTREQLLAQLQSPDMAERTVDVHIKNMRAKIERDPSSRRYIETVFGVGYRFAVTTDGAREE